MRSTHKLFAAAALAASMFAIPAAYAAEESLGASQFVKMCDEAKDGMVSKAEVTASPFRGTPTRLPGSPAHTLTGADQRNAR